ncbi:ornithine carbamoyltransferase [Allokutzneria sp. A3M-2-11 16]|uniref:ornithine carbamoyltransferase n=1 Tax=Allokutzneria sp. A3M-2-11 16 TaxID=2962043 RepID=UPI0020B8F862|nr:ornithine carbamoyltransferase [Allokutzneria sp. A3M-2-11 16]MCP3803365.1 ornithine carbamoyltransferase [Allokutzneria sp. A3M-2-11 16]
MRNLISLADLGEDDLAEIIDAGVAAAGDPRAFGTPLRGLISAIHFTKTSTRTRTAFSAATLRLGGDVLTFGPGDLQTNTGETRGDTARVLAGMVDLLVTRTAGPMAEMREWAGDGRMGVVNAMSAEEHPTQALADLTTLKRRFGTIEGRRVLYVGEGNNTAAAFALALPRFAGTSLELRCPPGYGLPSEVLAQAQKSAADNGSRVEAREDMAALPADAEVVYTTRWQTTGSMKAHEDWRVRFAPFQVDGSVLAASPGAVFMHDLPAHRGEEVTADVLDGPASIAFAQAENKLFSAMAVLRWCARTAGER